ncbi:GAF domain-containing protein [Belnapia sp. T6]|uniref:GAF domain-containing protein n=1 Tax=Belnapia mucosa TaxID=2804532 RepID=A0ABS1UXX9_9PROT|nr:GAF domain-containing protein [Belnapia mucosa]MBL6454322.1 GAF domain-containing protein [Belnapia mucosa]
MSRPDPLPHLARLAAALEAKDQPAAGFAALEEAAGSAIGHILFTVLLHDAARRENARLYSNQPAAYPPGGRKAVVETPWTTRLFAEGRPFIGRDAGDIRANFRDHALILSLGCESVLNLPVRWRGRTIGTVNLLHRAGWYEEADAATGRLIAGLAVPILLAARLPDQGRGCTA